MRYVCLDVETTGLELNAGDRVFEIAMIEVKNRQIGREFGSFVNPQRPLSEHSKKICQIEDERLAGEPRFADIADSVLAFLAQDPQTVIAAHNSKFDIGFLNKELSLANVSPIGNKYKIVDTVHIAKNKLPNKMVNLDALCSIFGIDKTQRDQRGHSAIVDARLLAKVLLEMCKEDSDEDIVQYAESEQIYFGIKKRKQTLGPRFFSPTEAEKIEHEKLMQKIKQ